MTDSYQTPRAEPSVPASTPISAMPPAPASGGYFTLAIATAALCIAAIAGYKALNAGAAGAPACYRTIDMQKLTRYMINDMLEKTFNVTTDEAGQTYRARLSTLDAELSKHASGCLLIRRDMILLQDPAIDVTGDVAAAIGIDFAQPAPKTEPRPLSTPAGSSAAASTPASNNEVNSKLD